MTVQGSKRAIVRTSNHPNDNPSSCSLLMVRVPQILLPVIIFLPVPAIAWAYKSYKDTLPQAPMPPAPVVCSFSLTFGGSWHSSFTD